MGMRFGDPQNPAGLLPQRRAQIHAGHDGNGFERGLVPQNHSDLIAKTQNERFVYDAYRR